MNKFTTGMLVGGTAAIMGVGYLMQDKKTCLLYTSPSPRDTR